MFPRTGAGPVVPGRAHTSLPTIGLCGLCPEGDVLNDRYEIMSEIGIGEFSRVFHARDLKTHSDVAVKVIRDSSESEVAILEHLRAAHSCLIEFKDHFTFESSLCLVFELFGESLYDLSRRCRLTLVNIKRVARDVLSGLAWLHGHNVVHCDIKPENILVATAPSVRAKLTDFGTSCFVGKPLFEYFQSRYYRAPEVILGERWGTAIDMWSFGCVLAEMSTGRVLFPGKDEKDQLRLFVDLLGPPSAKMIRRHKRLRKYKTAIARTNIKSWTDDQLLVDLLEKTLDWNQATRMTAEEALNHPWVADTG
jgi:dual specificity tyrosine-phosphorylation-regulated kinase 2/3/4